MSGALVEHEADLQTLGNPLQVFHSLVAGGADPEKMQALLELSKEWKRMEAEERFAAAIARFQEICPTVTKSRTAEVVSQRTGGRYKYTYAGFEDVMAAIRPALNECGLALDFSTEEPADNRLRVTCRIRHGTHFEDKTLTVPVPAMTVNDTQRYGAALSYAKRYALCAALNIVVADEDTDAVNVEADTISDDDIADLNDWIDRASEAIAKTPREVLEKMLSTYQIKSLDELPKMQLTDARTRLRKMVNGNR